MRNPLAFLFGRYSLELPGNGVCGDTWEEVKICSNL